MGRGPAVHRDYNPAVDLDAFRSTLLLEPSWTVSINATEFLHVPTAEIEVQPPHLRLGRFIRKVIDITPLRTQLIRVRARGRFRGGVDVLLFYAGEKLPSAVELRRRRRAFQRALASAVSQYYGQKVTRQVLHSDKRSGVAGAYPRLFLGSARAVIAVDPDEAQPVINAVMRGAFQWARVLKRSLTVVVPAGRKETIVSRLKTLTSLQSSWEWLEWDGTSVSPLSMDGPEVETHVSPFSPRGLEGEVARISAHAPGLLSSTPLIQGSGVSVRFRGLEVARVTPKQTIYPLGNDLRSVIETLSQQRRPGGQHPLAHAHEEAWLESNLIGQIRRILPVREDCVYPQVPSFAGEVRKIVDILTATDAGRLVVMEIKAFADPDLPFQALDYWQAVERHRRSGDLVKAGYFQGVEVQDEPALLVMVAPMLAYHRTLDRLLELFPKSVPVVKIGINQAWKRGIKVLRRQGPVG